MFAAPQSRIIHAVITQNFLNQMLWFDQKQLSAKIVKLIGNPRIEQLCLFLVVFLSFVFKL